MENLKLVSTPIEWKLKLIRKDKGKPEDLTYYKSLIGSLRYLTITRLDIALEVGLLSRFMEEPHACHL